MPMNPRLLRPLASGFNPRQIAGLAFWLDASDAATVTTVSGAVSEWRSKAGNGLAATQATAANRPTYTAAGRNGKNVVTFDGTESGDGDSLVTSAISLAQPYTIFWAGRSNGRLPGVTPADGPYIFDGSTSGNRVVINWNFAGTAANNGRLSAFAGTELSTSGVLAYNDWALLSATFSGAASTIGVNGTQIANGNAGTAAIVALRLGTRFDGAATSAVTFFEGPWGEFLIYNSILTASQRQKVEGYLAWKWGLQGQLPTNHPYAYSFPGFGSQSQPSNAEAVDWINRVYANGGTVSTSTANAVDAFCNAIDSAGIRDRFYRLNLFAGDSLNACLVPLYRGPSRTGTQYGNATDTNNGPFVTGDYSETTGLDSGATNSTKYLATGVTPDDIGTLVAHFSFYQAQDTLFPVNRRVIGSLGPGNNLFQLRFSGSPVAMAANLGGTALVSADDSIAGLTVVDRQAADSLKLFTDGTERSTIATNISEPLPTLEYFVYNHNNGGVPVAGQYFQGALRSYSLGTSLGDSGVAAYTAAMTAFQTALGRAA